MTDRTPDPTQRPPSKSDEEAIDWLIRLMEMAAEPENTTSWRDQIQDEFNVWATRSSANLRSFLEITSIYEALGECEAELIQELVARVDSPTDIVSLGLAPNQPAMAEVSVPVVRLKERVKWLWRPVLAIAATLALASVGVLVWRWAAQTTYRTEAGEWRRIRFEDGSVGFLSEQSEIRVSYSRATRRIELHRGQAVFDVTKDPRRPFLVATANAEIQVLGTRLDVDYHDGPTRVTVVDGSVRVSMASNALLPNHTRTLEKEEGAEVSDQAIVDSDPSEVKNTLASQREVLTFDQERLSVVVTHINFDSRKQLRLADAAARQKKISGRYMTDHPEGLVLAIQDLYPDLEVRETEDGWLVGERATGGRADKRSPLPGK